MSVTLRSGQFGNYYGNSTDSSNPLTTSQMSLNGKYIYSYLKNKGWSTNAICGMLGNMQVESSLNPGRWQSEDVGNMMMGYGLVQWTPASKYITWAIDNGHPDYSTMDANLDRIIYEINNNIQYYSTDEYPLSFSEFTKSTESPEYLASAFLKNYERAGVEVETTRRNNARAWFTALNGSTPGSGGNTGGSSKKKKKGFNFILFNRKRGRVYG